jgi:alpha-beta hydrolase superfamily lysophospholipase
VILAGHSTGGLVCSLYAHEGAKRGEVRGLWLNSAFFDWRAPAARRPWLHIAAAMGRFFPFLTVPERLPPHYNNLLLEQWQFDTRPQADPGFPALLRLDRRHQRTRTPKVHRASA